MKQTFKVYITIETEHGYNIKLLQTVLEPLLHWRFNTPTKKRITKVLVASMEQDTE